jgi:LmbE family N-acetylglucosaminyl deacetylase
MIQARLDQVRRILCLGAHADDIEIGCGGTLLDVLARREGVEVDWVVLSAQGRRAEEAVASAERFLAGAGRRRIVVKDFRDTFFPFVGAQIKEVFQDLCREVSPDLIFTHRREDMHQDHRLVAELTWCAFRDHLILEYDVPKYEGDLGSPNVFVPLAEVVCRRKVESLVEGFPSQADKPWFSADTFWSLLRIRGVECNSPTRLAEGLYCRKLTLG